MSACLVVSIGYSGGSWGPPPPSEPENWEGGGRVNELCAGSSVVMLGHFGDICKQTALKAP